MIKYFIINNIFKNLNYVVYNCKLISKYYIDLIHKKVSYIIIAEYKEIISTHRFTEYSNFTI